jgi:hypothetical protein
MFHLLIIASCYARLKPLTSISKQVFVSSGGLFCIACHVIVIFETLDSISHMHVSNQTLYSYALLYFIKQISIF